jgi:putative membrane protein
MTLLESALIVLVALLHAWFLVLEMFLWTRPIGLKVFRQTPEQARGSAVLAANQGLYNGFLAAGLLWGLLASEAYARDVRLFFLGCVIAAGCLGGATVSRRVFWIQAGPAVLAAALVLLNSSR